MEFNELVADFAERYSVADLSVEDNSVAVDIDGIVVTIIETADGLALTAEIGEPPAEGKDKFSELLLEANLESNAYFAKTRETEKYVLVRRILLSSITSKEFDSAIEALVNTAETWRKILTDFRPVAEEAAAVETNFSGSGFIQV